MSEDEAICTPSDTIRYIAKNRKVSVDALKVPQRLLITYQRSTYESAKNLINGKPFEWLYGESQPFCIGEFNNVEIGLAVSGLGRPQQLSRLRRQLHVAQKQFLKLAYQEVCKHS